MAVLSRIRAASVALAAWSACGLATSALSADIADLAPRSSFVVVSMPDWGALKGDLETSGLKRLWDDKAFRDYVLGLGGGMASGGFTELKNRLDEFGIDIDKLPPLGKTAGLASFFGPREDRDGRAIVGEGAEVMPHALLVASLDGGKGEDGRDLWEVVEEALDRADDNGDIELTRIEYGGATVWRVVTEYEEEEWDQDAWQNWDPENDDDVPQPKMRTVTDVQYVARASDHLVACSSFDVTRDAIDRLAGRDRGDTIGDVAEFVRGRDALPRNSRASVVLLPKLAAEGGLGDFGMMLPIPMDEPPREILEVLGLTSVTSLSAGLVTSTPDGVAEVRFAALMSQKRGIFSLITGADLPATPPAFVGPNASSIGVFRVNFAGILPLVREVLAATGDGAQAMFLVDQFAGSIEPLLNSIGPEVVAVSQVNRPLSANSQSSVVAVSMRDSQAVRDGLNLLGGVIGLMPRDFAGSQIWEAPFPPIALGLGTTHLFLGDPKGVESTMLAASQPDAPKLSTDPRWAPVARALGGGGVAMGWQDTKTALDLAAWKAENFEQVLREQVSQFGMPPEEVDRYVEFMLEQAPESARTAPPVASIARVIGDVVSSFRSTERGIEGRVVILKPAAR